MKKNRIFLGVLFVAMLLIGSGYAAWTQSFAVTNVVNTGELSFNVETQALKYGEYTEMSILNDGESKLDVTVKDAYPGAEYTYNMLIKNTGTMRIAFNKIEEKYLKDDVTLTYNFENAMEIEPNSSAIIPVKIIAGDSIAEKSKVEFSQIIQYKQFNDAVVEEPEEPAKPVNEFWLTFKPGSAKEYHVTTYGILKASNRSELDFGQVNYEDHLSIKLRFHKNGQCPSGSYILKINQGGDEIPFTLDFEKGIATINGVVQ